MDTQSALRSLPAVGALLETAQGADLVREFGHVRVTQALRAALDDLREAIRAGSEPPEDLVTETIRRARASVESKARAGLRPVINATGVIVHTNLGRSVLAEEAAQAVYRICRSYNNLEADLEAGKRSSRHVHVEDRLKSIIGAPAGAVFNNNAATVMLALGALARGREVIISRGQLIEIGGSFRIPEVIEQSGCILREVGATNRTHLADYERAINENTAAILVAHPSNYRIIGFSSTPSISDLADLAHIRGLLLIEDLGSGALIDLAARGVGDEPTPQSSLAAGADLVTFSGDKLLGGPQCGIAVGRPDLIQQMKKHPFARAVRVDKMTIAALTATLDLLADPDLACERIPTLRAATEPLESVRERAESIAAQLADELPEGFQARVVVDRSARIGGGSLPEEELDTAAVHVTPPAGAHTHELARNLRVGDPSVYTRVSEGALVLDARTIFPHEVEWLISAVVACAVAMSSQSISE